MTEKPVNEAASAKSLLAQWTNQQDNWVRALVSELVSTRRDLPATRLDYFFEAFLLEKELREGTKLESVNIGDNLSLNDSQMPLYLSSLSNVKNANALAENQTIEFNPKLNIVFGENATGKTGYVRILKRSASVRSAEEILPNFSLGKGERKPPSAKIAVNLGNELKEIDWNGEIGISPLNRIDIFDSRFTNIHVDEDLNYLFTPGELSLFPMIQKSVEAVKEKLDSEIEKIADSKNVALNTIPKECSFFTKIENLGASSDVDELEILAKLEEDIQQKIKSATEEISALESSAPQAQLKLLSNIKQCLEKIRDQFDLCEGFEKETYDASLKNLIENEEKHENFSKSAFTEFNIPGVLGEEWKLFISAGDSYRQVSGVHEHFPLKGDHCLYCRQDLGEQALSLLKKYGEFCGNQIKQKVDDSKKKLEKICENVQKLQLKQLEELSATFSSTSENKVLSASIIKGISVLSSFHAAIQNKSLSAPFDLDSVRKVSTEIKDDLTKNQTLQDQLKNIASEREKILKVRKSELIDLQARVELNNRISSVKNFVEEAKWADKAKIQLKKFPTIFRSLTETSKVASDQLLNQDFENKFRVECEFLKAPKVSVQFPGKQGKVARRKIISEEFRLSDILSEGEQKVIALADFLAEADLKPSKAPVVFDDPVNSLDYKRLEYVASRLVELSQSRQIIIFTHNIWFASELLRHFEKGNAKDCFFYNVQSDNKLSGVISKGSSPRTDSFNSLKGKVNDLIQTAGSLKGESQQALVDRGYDHLRSLCEVVVESELLCGVTKRYQPNVRMTVLENIKFDRLKEAATSIAQLFEKCCKNIVSHSQPLETLGVRPTLDNLKGDLKALVDARTKYLKDGDSNA